MKLDYNKTKIAIIGLSAILFFSLLINYRFKIVIQNVVSQEIIDLRIETYLAKTYAENLLDVSTTEEVRNDSVIRLINKLEYISNKIPSIYNLYYNDIISNSSTIQFTTGIKKFCGFLDKNKELIVTNSLCDDEIDVLTGNVSKLRDLSKLVDKLSDYSDSNKRYHLTISLFLKKSQFKELLYDIMKIYD